MSGEQGRDDDSLNNEAGADARLPQANPNPDVPSAKMDPALADSLRRLLQGEPWMQRAECHGNPYPFFPPEGYESKNDKEAREAYAKSICGRCSVREACLNYALRLREPHGIWGGQNEEERKLLLGQQPRRR
jgi:WhiB family transcriptional regulator, redox-sensing transcriptional regulator